MPVPVASLYDVSVGIHMVCGLLVLLLAVALVIFSVLGRKDDAKLEYALRFKSTFGPLVGVIFITGVFQVIDGEIKLLQVWLIGGLLLAVGAMGTIDGSWTPNARRALAGEGDAAKARTNCVNLAVSILIMFIGAYALMESAVG